ncbi:hypothetical protein HNR46_003187 [Haloferula luteola]|uniref:Uncharacterized protein n=1 Tax=Haloferula luteola TaxID=595692 RepID=A0A840VE79_9BACT|nr:DUF6375 family protein [Haloferula luteola]MBB5352938.1 hypothetical protein [Haloferula luteola]
MKIWNAYGSEHSMNLVMIGCFKDAGAAEAAKDAIEELQAYFSEHDPDGEIYTREVMDLLSRCKVSTVAATELEQFRYDFSVNTDGQNVLIKTDEADVSAICKLLIDRGAKVQIYSKHDYPEEVDSGNE